LQHKIGSELGHKVQTVDALE